MPVLATGKVRYVGEPVALVVAESRYSAEDGAAAVRVEYEPLPVVLEISEALAGDAPALHDEVAGNLYNSFETSTPGIDEAFESADEVVELELTQQRYGAAAMEGRATIADWEGSGRLTTWLSSQVPHIARTGLAKFLGLAESSVRVISPDVGGGFGPKCVVYQEEVAVAAASRRLRRPVKWVSDRSEDLLTTIHGREQIHRVRAAASADGVVSAVSVEIFASNGAYAPWPFGAGLDSGQASENVCGPYAIQLYERRVHAVATNKTPMGPVPRRGPGDGLHDHRAGHGRARVAAGARPPRDPPPQPRHLVPTQDRHRPALRERGLSALTRAARGGHGLAARRGPRTRRSLAQGLHRGLGVALRGGAVRLRAAVAGIRQMEMTFGYDTASMRVEPDGRCGWRWASTTTVRATRRRSPRSPPTSWASTPAKSRWSTATPTPRPTAPAPGPAGARCTAAARRCWPRGDIREKMLRSRPRCSRPAPPTWSWAGAGSVRGQPLPRHVAFDAVARPRGLPARPAARRRRARAGVDPPLRAAGPRQLLQRRPRRPRRGRPRRPGQVRVLGYVGGRGLRHDRQPD